MTAGDQSLPVLEKSIVRQVEFYFGDYNLHRDKFMKEHISKNDGWFDMDTMLKFQRLSSLCSEPGTILAALKNSPSNLMEIDVENQRIRRKPSRPVPENDEKYRQDLKRRTIYVKGFPQTETIEDITEFLEDYGKIEGVFLRKYNNPHTGSIFKGSLFATFSKLEDAEKFLQAPMVYYKDKQLEKKSKDDFWKEKEKEHSEKMVKIRKKKQEKSQSEKSQSESMADQYSFVHVTDLDDQTITHIHMKEFLRDLGAFECKFFSRYEKNGPTGYIMFGESEAANHFFGLLKEISNDNTGLIKETKVKFELPTSELRQQALECYYDFRGLGKDGKKKGGRLEMKKKYRKHKPFSNDDNNIPAKKAKLEVSAADDD